MSELVARLHDVQRMAPHIRADVAGELCAKAAAEIERLGLALSEAKAQAHEWMNRYCNQETTTRKAEQRAARADKLAEALKPFSEIAGEFFARNYNKPDVVLKIEDPHGDRYVITAGDLFQARAALAAVQEKK